MGSFSALYEELVRTFPDSKPRGDAFEEICQHYLRTHPAYQKELKKVWRWDEWPDRWGPDTGIDLVAEELALDEALEGADLVVTGEGMLDATSYQGKVVGGVSAYAAAAGLPVLVVAGQVTTDLAGHPDVVSLVERFGEERARTDPAGCVEAVVAEVAGGAATGVAGTDRGVRR